jgi:hypothetical protein
MAGYFSGSDSLLWMPSSGGLNVLLRRRNRQSFRDRLLALGGRWEARQGGIYGLRVEDAETVREIIAQEYPEWSVETSDERPVQKRPGDRVRWTFEDIHGGHGRAHHGYVRRAQLFSTSANTISDKNGDRKRIYYLHADLPGVRKSMHGVAAQADSQEAVEKLAEEVLAKFLDSIGAAFKDEEE